MPVSLAVPAGRNWRTFRCGRVSHPGAVESARSGHFISHLNGNHNIFGYGYSLNSLHGSDIEGGRENNFIWTPVDDSANSFQRQLLGLREFAVERMPAQLSFIKED
jgi:hypothetical protein